jgi:hypothetical protein
MKKSQLGRIGLSILTCGVLLFLPLSLTAQESTQEQRTQPGALEKPEGSMMGRPEGSMSGPGDRRKGASRRAAMQQRHAEMEKVQQEMLQDLQTQLAAIREHTKMMESITDEKQLLTEMKKHQQMTDALLGTMVEQREQMFTRMKEHHKHMHERMERRQQSGEKKPDSGSGEGAATKESQSGGGKPEGHETRH